MTTVPPTFLLAVPWSDRHLVHLDGVLRHSQVIEQLYRRLPFDQRTQARPLTVQLDLPDNNGLPVSFTWAPGSVKEHNLRAMRAFTALTSKHLLLTGPVLMNNLSMAQVTDLCRAMMMELTGEESHVQIGVLD